MFVLEQTVLVGVKPAGNVSATENEFAVPPPMLVTVIVYWLPPTTPGVKGPLFVLTIVRSAPHGPSRSPVISHGLKSTLMLTFSPLPGPTGPGPSAAFHQLHSPFTGVA